MPPKLLAFLDQLTEEEAQQILSWFQSLNINVMEQIAGHLVKAYPNLLVAREPNCRCISRHKPVWELDRVWQCPVCMRFWRAINHKAGRGWESMGRRVDSSFNLKVAQ